MSRWSLCRYFGWRWLRYQLEYIHLYLYNCHSWVHTLIDNFELVSVPKYRKYMSSLFKPVQIYTWNSPFYSPASQESRKGQNFYKLDSHRVKIFLNPIRSVFQKCFVFEITELFMPVINKYRSFYKNNHFNFRIIWNRDRGDDLV